jgi:hypothetical protein
MNNERLDQLEHDLRVAGRSFDDVEVSPDAWQENRRRLRTADSARGRRVLLTAAAGVAGVVAIGAAALMAQTSDGSGLPAGGRDATFATENILGPIVQAEQLTLDGRPTVHEIVLTDTTGDGPDLCDRFVAEGSGSGSCTRRDLDADAPGVAFDWLSGTEGDGGLRGVLAGVDARVTRVQVWMDNGDMVLAQLHPTGWDDTSMFALTLAGDAPTPQRLVAYGRDGNVLQTVDLANRFGRTWLAPRTQAPPAR